MLKFCKRPKPGVRSYLNTSGQGFLLGASLTAVSVLSLEAAERQKTHKKPILRRKDLEEVGVMAAVVGALTGGGSLYGQYRAARR